MNEKSTKETIMKKGILLLFISNYKENPEVVYQIESSEKESYTGIQTNDAPIKYLLHQAIKNGDVIQKIICIITEKVKEAGDFLKFQNMVNDYISSEEELQLQYQDFPPIEFCQIDYETALLETTKKAWRIYSQISDCLREENAASAYVDYTGGLRDISFLMVAIIRYMEYYNIVCKKIVYSNNHNRTIQSIDCIYQMFQLLNGVDQFVRTGNAELLGECYQQENDVDTKEILELLIQFSKAISLCDIRQVDSILPKISKGLKKYNEEKKQGFFIEMFADLTSIIRKKLYMEENEAWGYPQVIRWCLDNNMLQQALTLYIEKMPKYYYDTHLLNLPELKQQNIKLGGTEETYAFYTNLFEACLEDKKLKVFEKALKELDFNNQNFNMEQLQNVELGSEEGKRAIGRLIDFLTEHYEKGIGERKTQGMLPEIYGKDSIKAKSGTGFLNEMKNKSYLFHYFFYQDRSAYEKTEVGTYEKKVAALDKVKDCAERIEQSNVPNKILYEMMRYYCALKLMRNKINHASELESTEDEKKAIRQLEERHGVCMGVEFDNIKAIVREGLEAYREQGNL